VRVLNERRFSYRAAFNQDALQLRSAVHPARRLLHLVRCPRRFGARADELDGQFPWRTACATAISSTSVRWRLCLHLRGAPLVLFALGRRGRWSQPATRNGGDR
jgi:hypothetical protein